MSKAASSVEGPQRQLGILASRVGAGSSTKGVGIDESASSVEGPQRQLGILASRIGAGSSAEVAGACHPSPAGRGAGGEGRIIKVSLPPDLKAFARELRETQTDAETAMWYLLRDRRFLGLKFRRQHPMPPFVLDFYCQELKLAVELDGGQHNQDAEVERDAGRTAELERRGVRVVRYWNDEVLKLTESVLEDLILRVQQLGESLTPSPSPEGRGEARQ